MHNESISDNGNGDVATFGWVHGCRVVVVVVEVVVVVVAALFIWKINISSLSTVSE